MTRLIRWLVELLINKLRGRAEDELTLEELIIRPGPWGDDIDACLKEVLFDYYAAYGDGQRPSLLTFLSETATYVDRRLSGHRSRVPYAPSAARFALLIFFRLLDEKMLASDEGGRIVLTPTGRAFADLPFAAAV